MVSTQTWVCILSCGKKRLKQHCSWQKTKHQLEITSQTLFYFLSLQPKIINYLEIYISIKWKLSLRFDFQFWVFFSAELWLAKKQTRRHQLEGTLQTILNFYLWFSSYGSKMSFINKKLMVVEIKRWVCILTFGIKNLKSCVEFLLERKQVSNWEEVKRILQKTERVRGSRAWRQTRRAERIRRFRDWVETLEQK